MSPEEQKELAAALIRDRSDVVDGVKRMPQACIFVESSTLTVGELERLKSWIASKPLNSREVEPSVKRLMALAPLAGTALIRARVNFEQTSHHFYIAADGRRIVHYEQFPYPNIERFIKNSAEITEIFGYWPTFHDAEVINLTLDRGGMDFQKGVVVLPSLTVEIDCWELTPDVDPKGYFILTKRTKAKLKFQGVDLVHLIGFNQQNAILGLSIERPEEDGAEFQVLFEPAFGLEARFQCSQVEVLTAEPSSTRTTQQAV